MKSTNKHKIDKAWDTLHAKLESDGLISKKRDTNKSIFEANSLKWVSGIAALIACIVIFSYIDFGKSSNMKILLSSEQNFTTMASLSDGSIIGLRAQSSIQYPENFDSDKRQIQLEGEAYFDIAKDEKRQFVIETQKAFIEVLGTAFCIETNNENFAISVQRGKVKVSPKDGRPSIYVEKGESLYFNSISLKKELESDPLKFAKYLGQMQFKDECLKNIVRAVNLCSDSTTILVECEHAERKLTIQFSSNDSYKVANLIALALNLDVRKEENFITLY